VQKVPGALLTQTSIEEGAVSAIPSDIDQIYEKLKIEITWLHGRWIVYRQLFAKSEKRIELLNECASAFFYIIQDVLLWEIQVTLSKLMDQARSGKFDNLSLEQLQARVEVHGNAQLALRLRQLLDALHLKSRPFRTWRNKQIVHLDLATAMKTGPDQLPAISREMIEETLALIREYMNQIEQHYHDAEMGYEHFMLSSDGEALAAILRYGLRYEELLRAGRIPLDDWCQGEWSDA
jgi:hypothetical protein